MTRIMKSTARENYLKTILELQETHNNEIVSLSAVAGKLGLAAGTVTGMIKQLSAAGLVDYRAYVGCRLTEQGRRRAVTILRNHRIMELFLVKIVGLDWAEVHDEAERLEHVVSPKVLAGIDRLLGYPEFDPHGDPIPTEDGVMAKTDSIKLSYSKAGDRCKITRVLDESKPFLEFIGNIALFPGTEIHVDEVHHEAGTIRLKPENADTVVMSLDSAEKLLIQNL